MDKYIQVKKIGEGSFGKALLVKRKEDGKQCVVKQVSISKMSPKEKEESRKEVQLLSKLKHPNIVTYLESFEGSGNLYIVMDYCEGGDLYQLIVRQRGIHMDEGKVLDIFVQCCLAIKHIHDRKVLHRDIKTQNIFLTKHHIVKLGDFGIARVLKNTMELARTCIGTPYYLSPEIVENRPYNNKSDIWSLGCVLYELATLKHAFEAGNMKNLVLKICRGSYPPVPNKYSFELRSLVAHCFKRSPSERPSINTLLKKPIIQQRISKFLLPEEVKEEFSHTVLHRQPKGNPVSRPVSAVVPKHVVAGKRQNDLVSVYGVSVAKKPVVRKPLAAVNPVVKPKSGGSGQNAKNSGKRLADARERRRKEILSQEQQYQAHLKKMQKQRYEKQQAVQIGRAREDGWKNILGTDEKDKMKKYQPKIEDRVIVNKKFVQPEEKPENSPNQQKQQQHEQIEEKPLHAWSVEEQHAQRKDLRNEKRENNGEKERVRMLDEFWQRKKEAAANKARGNEALAGPSNPILQMHEERMRQHNRNVNKPPMHPAARNGQEAEYLKQLEQIRRQNYNERKALKGYHDAVNAAPKQQALQTSNDNVIAGDPRYDVDARRKKIQALKEQADRRAGMLKEQLERRRQQVQEKVERDRIERMQKWKEERESFQQQQRQKEVIPVPNREAIQPKDIAVPSIGIATAMKEMAQPKLFRSLSEGEIQNLVKPKPKAARKVWGVNPSEPIAFANIPLEITASAMEATRVIEPDPTPQRKGWNEQGKTQFVSMLHNLDLIGAPMATMTIKNSGNESIKDDQLTSQTSQSHPGETIVISSKGLSGLSPKTNVGETITISGKPTTKNLPVITQDSSKTIVSFTNQENNKDYTTNEKSDGSSDQQYVTEEKQTEEEGQKKREDGLEVIALEDETSATSDANYVTVKKAWSEKGGETISLKKTPIKISPEKEKLDSDTHLKTPEKEISEDHDNQNEGGEQVDVRKSPDSNIDEESFYTPDRTFGLQSGCYDIEKKEVTKMLRTCSLPDLRPLVIEDIPEEEEEAEDDEEEVEDDEEEVDEDNEISKSEEVEPGYDGGNDGDEAKEKENDDGRSDQEDQEFKSENEAEEDDDEFDDYESMLESMRNVLGKTSEPSSVEGTLHGPEGSNKKDEEEIEEDDDEWEEEEDDSGGSASSTIKEKAKTLKDDRENLFSRIEESRKALEDELGMDLFIKIYRHVQMMQDNEDDALEVGTTEISNLLGDKENLYQKVLYLVIADSAYSEGNDGTF